MTETTPIGLVVEVREVPETGPVADPSPYFLLAYWPRNKWWTIHTDRFADPDGEEITRAITALKVKGWTHIKVCKLP
jgi:hypothetical protein